MSLVHDNEKVWLIKASGRVLGPYAFSELREKILSREVSIIDEVRNHQERWGFIREKPELAALIEEVRNRESAMRDDTQTDVVPHKSYSDDLTPTTPFVAPVQASPVSESVAEEPPKKSPPPSSPSQVAKILAKTKKKAIIRSTSSRSGAWYKIPVLMVLFAGIGAGIYFSLVKAPAPSVNREDYLKLAQSHFAVGDYNKSLDFYKQADRLQSIESSQKWQMAALFMVVENRNIEARKIFEDLLTRGNLSENLATHLTLLRALSFLKEGQLDQAQTIYNDLLTKDALNPHVHYFLAVILYLKNQYEAAWKSLTNSIQKLDQPLLFLLKGLTAYHFFEAGSGADKIRQTMDDLDRFANKNMDYRIEALFLRALLAAKIEDKKTADAAVQALIQENPDLTRNHIHDVALDYPLIAWENMQPLCARIAQGALNETKSLTLRIFCDYQRQDLTSALATSEKALLQQPQNPSFHEWQALLYLRSKRPNDAKMALQALPQGTFFGDRIRAEICWQQKEFSCAEETWKKVLAQRGGDVSALAGLAWLFYQRNELDLANDFMKKGFILSPSYRPLVELKGKMNHGN